MPSPQKLPKKDFYDGLIEAMRDGIASGVGNFFSNIWVGAGRFQEDFLGVDDYDGSRIAQNVDEDLRFAKVIRNIIENIDILYQIVEIILHDIISRLPYKQQKRIVDAFTKNMQILLCRIL